MKKILYTVISSTTLLPSIMMFILIFSTSRTYASPAYNPSYLISDNIFTDTSTMSANDIQNFLVSENSGLANYKDIEDCGNPLGTYYSHAQEFYTCGTSQLASKIIYDAAMAYGINPRTIIATLQKEQSLITTPNPTQSQINCAMGYNSCNGFSGFYYQVDNAAWQFRIYIELMNNRSYWGYAPSSYPCKNAGTSNGVQIYSTGLYPGNTVTFSDPGGTPETIVLDSSATAALYCYTPYVGPYSLTGYSGSYNFVLYFELWFGSVASPCYNDNNITSTPTGASIIPDHLGPGLADHLALTIPNNTGSACSEVHIWNSNLTGFINDYATNLPVFNPSTGQIISADLYGTGQDQLIYVKYLNTGSGHIELHIYNSQLTAFNNDYATNLPSDTPSDGQVISGDFYGNGHDELAYVKYQNTGSGKVEVHIWNSNLTGFINDYATNVPGFVNN